MEVIVGFIKQRFLHARLRKLLRLWMEFRELSLSYEGRSAPTPLAEREFLKLKGELAAQLESLRRVLPAKGRKSEGKEIDEILSMLLEQTPPGGLYAEPAWDPERFKRVWQEHYIKLYKLKGMRFEAEPEAAESDGAAKLPGLRASKRPKFRRLLIIRPFSIGAIIIAFGFAVIAARALGLRRAGSGFVVDRPDSFGEAVSNANVLLRTILVEVNAFLQPVVAHYGPVWTAVMIALLLSAFGYMAVVHR